MTISMPPDENKYVNPLRHPGYTPSEALEEWNAKERELDFLFQRDGAKDAFHDLNVSPEVIAMAKRIADDIANGSDRNTVLCYLNDLAEFAGLILADRCQCNGQTNDTSD